MDTDNPINSYIFGQGLTASPPFWTKKLQNNIFKENIVFNHKHNKHNLYKQSKSFAFYKINILKLLVENIDANKHKYNQTKPK